MSKDDIEFVGITAEGEEVIGYRGHYWENLGIGYIITKEESVQPPIRRHYAVDPATVRVEIKEQ